jgi:hypothetical protein
VPERAVEIAGPGGLREGRESDTVRQVSARSTQGSLPMLVLGCNPLIDVS